MLYPIKFKPRIKERIWGGKVILEKRGKAASRLPKDKLYGESWDLSSVKGDISVVANGMLKGNNLEEIIEVYMGELVGERHFERFGLEFPLLIKYLDCNDKLSVQVHPSDAYALREENSFGKTEMWYVLEADEGASLVYGLKNGFDKAEFEKALAWAKEKCVMGFDKNPVDMQISDKEKEEQFEFVVKMAFARILQSLEQKIFLAPVIL